MGRIFDIETKIHASFLLVLVWSLVSTFRHGGTAVTAVAGLVFTLAIFASVLLHEFGHALTARRFGIRTRQIVLLPIGGVAQLEHTRMPPRAEFWIALAGPIVSLTLSGLLFALAAAMGVLGSFSWLGGLAWANLMIGVFNLLPAFPMDGGRVLRAGLAKRMSYGRATQIAAKVGQASAIGLGFLSLLGFGSPMLMLIAVFIFFAARAELNFAERMGFSQGPRGKQMPSWWKKFSQSPFRRPPRNSVYEMHETVDEYDARSGQPSASSRPVRGDDRVVIVVGNRGLYL